MKTRLAIALIALLGLFSLTGCNTARKVLMVTQEIEGSGSFSLGRISVVVENARQEEDRYHADKIDLVAPKIEIHATDYSRPLLKKKGTE